MNVGVGDVVQVDQLQCGSVRFSQSDHIQVLGALEASCLGRRHAGGDPINGPQLPSESPWPWLLLEISNNKANPSLASKPKLEPTDDARSQIAHFGA